MSTFISVVCFILTLLLETNPKHGNKPHLFILNTSLYNVFPVRNNFCEIRESPALAMSSFSHTSVSIVACLSQKVRYCNSVLSRPLSTFYQSAMQTMNKWGGDILNQILRTFFLSFTQHPWDYFQN